MKVETQSQQKFLGIHLSGGKSERTWTAEISFFPEPTLHKDKNPSNERSLVGSSAGKLFLTDVSGDWVAEEFISGDLKLTQWLTQKRSEAPQVFLALDSPTSLPKCMRCVLECPGYETCQEPEIQWMRSHYDQSKRSKKRPRKFITPYSQRAVESYWSERLPQLEFGHAMGSNHSAKTARAHFLLRRWKEKSTPEVWPHLSVWILGQAWKINKTHLKVFRNSIGGEEARSQFLKVMIQKTKVFIYQSDLKTMIKNLSAFEAFITAYTNYLFQMKKCQDRPAHFPASEVWIAAPEEGEIKF